MCTPFVSVTFTFLRFGILFSMDAKSPPVCSSCQAPARNIGTLIFEIQFIGERSSMIVAS